MAAGVFDWPDARMIPQLARSADTSGSAPALVGQSPRIRQVLRLVDKLGRSRCPVLLLGESGTGKEVVARSIHNVEAVGPFVTIDCSSLVGPLMESELFGHTKGSFTGALNSKVGLIELANGGTAFLDEIGELPVDVQAKLLRVLQEKEFRPVGSPVVKKSDFRVIAATNRNLAKEVEAGRFRSDLYYRLNVVNLKLSALRERKEDIPALITHFLQRHGRNHRLTDETLHALLEYDWPGNVRELENCILHLVALNSGPLIHTAELPSPIQNRVRADAGLAMAACAGGGSAPAATKTSTTTVAPSEGVIPLAEVERRTILHALEYTKGDRVMAAHLLGIGRTTLYRKLKEYGMKSSESELS